ncbi:folliculin-interacting protein 2 [Culicoides brevitarsis]|uniref:folliculin-interacting protein 2 n=1 Tax=Culicoides brevitarsis TaxID=469753 RepID=UPI00307B6406
MFNKIFASTKRKNQTGAPHSHQHHHNHQNTISPFEFADDQTRIVLFRECDLRGTKLLFDSDAFSQIPVSPKKGPAKNGTTTKTGGSEGPVYEISDGIAYRYSRQQKQPKSDENVLSEMIFGSVALALRGTTFKVHWLHDRMMISQVFLAPIQMQNGTRHSQSTRLNIVSASHLQETGPEGTSVNSLSLSICVKSDLALSHPLDVPEEHHATQNPEVRGSTGDSGYSGTDPWTATSTTSSRVSNRSSLASVFSDLDISHHGRKHSIDSTAALMPETNNSSGNIQRRISRHVSTSMENRFTNPDLVGQLGEYYMTNVVNCSASELSVPRIRRNSEICPPPQERGTSSDIRSKRKAISGDVLANSSRRSSARRPRLGIAVIFMLNKGENREMKLFCSEHMLMLEGMINRLRMAVENAYISRQRFLQIMLSAFHETSNWLYDLFTAPRIKFPVWISLSTGFVHNAVQLAAQFMKDLNLLMNHLDTKETNFFMSRLVTAVLTCHLGWVNTVAPICIQKQAKRDGSVASVETLVNEERMRLSEISKLHPYNALWAQLGDLHGAVGTPLRLAKTVVYGTASHLKIVERILNILTYFIRCGEIKRLEVRKKVENSDVGAIIEKQLTNNNKISQEKIESEPKSEKTETKNRMMRRSNTQKSNLALLDQQLETSSASSSSSNIPFAMDSDTSLVVKGRFQVTTATESDVVDCAVPPATKIDENGVVFVLGGDNEELVGLKQEQETANGAIKKSSCSTKHKKHSGVKFDFEKYPQIAKNYMRNKNLEMNNYDFFEKGLKMELQWKLNYEETQTKTKEEECECCKGAGAHYLQTPSNASELEFSSDDPLQEQHTSTPRIVISEAQTTCLTNHSKLPLAYFPLDETREVNIVRNDNPQINLIELPFKETSDDNISTKPLVTTSKQDKLLPGFSPSLFVGLSNHFISDMILQGIITARNDAKWEDALRQDLMYAAKCISLEQVPIENVAIVANIDNWDVRLLSSNSSYLASTATNKTFGIVGMSQLVSTLLETVQCMYQSGASAFQCMSLIESKLQEIYLQSETLSEFLLETEFCSLSMLTNTLELSDNDIPLLLAIASIHSPQVTKKYGVSTR